jgi:hypothetical protein
MHEKYSVGDVQFKIGVIYGGSSSSKVNATISNINFGMKETY